MGKMILAECPDCGFKRMIRLSNYIRGRKTGLCHPCANKRLGYGSGISQHEGYILIKQPNHPRASYGGFVKRAVLVMESTLGRFLLPNEHIHHINGKRDDDRLDNLIIVSNSEHAKIHMKKKPNIRNKYVMALSQK